ncbi:MAG: AAA family ATPase [Thermoleophilia bacterium]
MTPIRQIQREHGIVGRERELAMALAVVGAGRHLLLEGPVGVGKTTVGLAVCGHLGRATLRVDGDDRYSESKLTGWFDPPLVLQQGYREESFFAGPLVEAMRRGCVLFINELNRMPEQVQNVLLPALDERLIEVPSIGEVHAAEGFQVVATQNPAEYIATGHLSEALRDRFEHLALDYQPAGEEADIVATVTGSHDAELVAGAVRLTRATRRDPRFRKGASVRGAIATVAIAADLHAAAGLDARGGVSRETLRRAAEAALTTRVDLRDDIDTDLAATLDELFARVVDRDEDPDAAPAGEGAVEGQGPAELAPASRGPAGERVPTCAPEPPAPEPTLGALAERFRLPEESLDGWQVAVNLTRSECRIADSDLRFFAEQLAAAAVLQRAARLVGPLRAATHAVREPLREPYGGELDVEATLENVLGKPFPEPEDWIVQHREERHHQVCLMVDASPSMEGENMAIAAVATAVLALKLHPEDLSVVVFDARAHSITRLGAPDPPVEVVRRMLAKPINRRTNIAAALELGAAELERSRNPRRSGLLITDGVVTMGGDPVHLAHRFPRLFVLFTESQEALPSQQRKAEPLCRRLADAGRGDVYPVRAYPELPRRLLDVASRMLR